MADEMKRFAIVCTLLIIFVTVKAQREPRYKYSYSFQLSTHGCPPAILKDTFIAAPAKSSLEVELLDCDGKAILSSATISLKIKDSTTVLTAINDTGKIVILQPAGLYSITASAIGFIGFTKNIEISNNKKHYMVITPGKLMPEIYDIEAKKPLPAKKIAEIKACVEQNPSNPFKCSAKNEYYISIQI